MEVAPEFQDDPAFIESAARSAVDVQLYDIPDRLFADPNFVLPLIRRRARARAGPMASSRSPGPAPQSQTANAPSFLFSCLGTSSIVASSLRLWRACAGVCTARRRR